MALEIKKHVKRARISSTAQTVVQTSTWVASIWAFLVTFFDLTSKALAAVLGWMGVGIAVASYATNDEETQELKKAKEAEETSGKNKQSWKAEIYSALSILGTILCFAAKPLAWLAEWIAWPIAIVFAGIVGLATWWKNKQHAQLRESQTSEIKSVIPESVWKSLSPKLRADLIALEDLKAEKMCSWISGAIFGGITSGATYAAVATCSYLAFLAACPPLALIAGIITLGCLAGWWFHHKFMAGVKATANKQINEIRAELGLKPPHPIDATKSSTSSILLAASTFLGIISLITNPILTLVQAIGAGIAAAVTNVLALCGVKSRARERAGLLGRVRTELKGKKPDVVQKEEQDDGKSREHDQTQDPPKIISNNPDHSSFFRLHRTLETKFPSDSKNREANALLEPVMCSRLGM